MDIIVCVKVIRSELITLAQNDNDFALNPYDQYALRDVISIKKRIEEDGDICTVVCLSMGSDRAKDSLIRCIAAGADEAVLLSDKVFAGADTVATTYTLSVGIEKIGIPDVIVCGCKAIDGETGHVPYGLSKRLGIPYITNVKKIEALSNDSLLATINDSQGTKMIRTDLPVIIGYNDIATDLEISLRQLKKSKRQGIKVFNNLDIGADKTKCGTCGSFTKVVGLHEEKSKQVNCKTINGQLEDKVMSLFQLINSSLSGMR